MKMYLIHQDLFECVTGECEDTKRQQKALATIVLGVDPGLLYLIGTEPESAKEVWQILEMQFQKDRRLNKLSLKKRLYNMTPANDDVNYHIKEMTEIFQSLSLLGCKVEDEEKVCLLLSSLPKQYDTLVTAFGTADKAPSFEQVTERLLADVIRSSQAQPVHQPEEVMKVTSKVGKTTVKCFHCHKEGHFKNSCPLLRQQNKKKTHSKPSSFLVEEQCLLGEDCRSLRHNKWVLDSGATSHIVGESL